MLEKISRILVENRIPNFCQKIDYKNIANKDAEEVLNYKILIYPEKPIFDISEMNRFENRIESLIGPQIEGFSFIKSSKMLDNWIFGVGVLVENRNLYGVLSVVGGKPKQISCQNDLIVYPNVDIARTAALYHINTSAIPLDQLDVYKSPSKYSADKKPQQVMNIDGECMS